MEREKEIFKLLNVLRRTYRMAQQSELTGGGKEDAAAFATDQYNRVLARLKELNPGVGTIFEPLPAGSSLTVVAMACRQLYAYYEDELGPATRAGRAYAFAFDSNKFREFWEKSAREFEDMGEFIRESIDQWLKHNKEASRTEKATTESSK